MREQSRALTRLFYDWLLYQEFGLELCKAMTNQPSKGCGAGCDFSASFYRAANQWSSEPSLGAQIFFGSRGDKYHTGIVVGYDAAHVYTVEGNTGYSAGYSGGAVLERTYGRGDSRITGYGVPRWSMVDGKEPVVDVTYDGELIRWYVLVDPDFGIQYLVNDRGGCCVRLDSYGNVMGVSYEGEG